MALIKKTMTLFGVSHRMKLHFPIFVVESSTKAFMMTIDNNSRSLYSAINTCGFISNINADFHENTYTFIYLLFSLF